MIQTNFSRDADATTSRCRYTLHGLAFFLQAPHAVYPPYLLPTTQSLIYPKYQRSTDDKIHKKIKFRTTHNIHPLFSEKKIVHLHCLSATRI